MANAARKLPDPPPAPLTAGVVRKLIGWPQIRVAALAGTSVGTVRIFEIDPMAVSAEKRERLAALYRRLHELLLRG